MAGIFDVVPTEASTYVATTMSEPKMRSPSSVRRLGLGRRTRIPSVGARRRRSRGTGSSLLPVPWRTLAPTLAPGPEQGPCRDPTSGTPPAVPWTFDAGLRTGAWRRHNRSPRPCGRGGADPHPGGVEDAVTVRGPERFSNRELSWLDFGARLLDLADDERSHCSSG